MKQGFMQEHWRDAKGRPAGGVTTGHGFTISWQNGPLGSGEARVPPNGAFVEDVLEAVIGRLVFYQASEFACLENSKALVHLTAAAEWLATRTKDREARGVEGTHTR